LLLPVDDAFAVFAADEHIRRAGVETIVVITIRTNDRGVAIHCDRIAELVVGTIGDRELGLLRPGVPAADEHIHRAVGGGTHVDITRRTNDRGVAVHCDRLAEIILCGTIGGQQFSYINFC